MKNVKFLLSAACALFAVAAMAQQDFSDPKYAVWGDTPQEREQNILNSNFLKESLDNKDYNAAAHYLKELLDKCPKASQNTFVRGITLYKNKIARAKSIAEKNTYTDSLMIVYDLRNEYFGGQVDAGAVAVAALYHDASEILTGDMPTPIKYYNPDIRDAYKQVEAIACRKLTGMLPQRLQDIYAGLLTPADPEVEELVKAADKLSAHIKCLEEEKAGNHEFCAAARQTRQALEDMHLPEVDLFLRDFLPSFRLTLDELK